MATSIISYKDGSIDANDTILLFVIHYLLESKSNDSPQWYKDYVVNVLELQLDIKPIGWMDMEFDEYLVDDRKRQYMMESLSVAKESLKNMEIISTSEFNRILKMKEKEGYEIVESKLNASVIIKMFDQLIEILISASPEQGTTPENTGKMLPN